MTQPFPFTHRAPGPVALELSPELASALEKLTYRNGLSLSENLRRAVGTQLYLEDALARGERLVLRSADLGREQILSLSGGPK